MAEKITQTTIDKIKNIKSKPVTQVTTKPTTKTITKPEPVEKPQTPPATPMPPEVLKQKTPTYSHHIKMTHHYNMYYRPDYSYMTSHVDVMLTFDRLKHILRTNKWHDVESYKIDDTNQCILVKRKNCKQYFEEISIHITDAKRKSSNNSESKKEEDTRRNLIKRTLKLWNPKVKN